MPTYQTTPYISWTFPDQAIAMNRKGVRPLEATHLPKQDMVIGREDPWAKATRESVLAGLHTNRVKEQGMLFKRNTTDRTQAFERPAHLSQSRINGKFMAPSYEFTQTAGGLRGGTGLLTPEGRAWGKKQLLNRIQQLDAIDSGDYSRRPERTNLDPKLDNLDAAFMKLLDNFGAGYFTFSTADQAERLVVELANVGAVISPNKLASYAETVSNLQIQVQRILTGPGAVGALPPVDPYSPDPISQSERRKIIRILKAIQTAFNRFQRLAEEIARVAYEPESVRRQVMEEILSRMPRSSGLLDRRAPYIPRVVPASSSSGSPNVPRGPNIPFGFPTRN